MNDEWPHVIFEFAKAHRGPGAQAGVIHDFRFDNHDLTQYDEIWQFGIDRTGLDPLSDAELKAVAQFMDGGGGVFATGDHEDLGQPMSARVPRVGSMRRWHWPGAGPDGEPVAPDQSGPGRHDTLVDDPATASPEGDQSDDIPQVVRPRWYSSSGWDRSSADGSSTRIRCCAGPAARSPTCPITCTRGSAKFPATCPGASRSTVTRPTSTRRTTAISNRRRSSPGRTTTSTTRSSACWRPMTVSAPAWDAWSSTPRGTTGSTSTSPGSSRRPIRRTPRSIPRPSPRGRRSRAITATSRHGSRRSPSSGACATAAGSSC